MTNVDVAIHILSSETVARIAAGEVIERPASVVKELMENSLDAGARAISVEVLGGGLKLLRVVDNGMGIPTGEVELAFQRHATSKLSSPEDMEAIATLGFRGEALPSIAAVAEVVMVTRPAAAVAGTWVRLKGGVVVERGKRGCPEGTTLTVRHLFQEVPARLQFLKSLATETSHISSLVSHYSLAFPEVRFALIVEGRTAFQSPGTGSLKDALGRVWGPDLVREMLPVKGNGEPGVEGFASPPARSLATRGHLAFFVNRRWIQSAALVRAVEEAYHGLIPAGRYPQAVLHLKMAPGTVDVNVHPAKREVRFRDERGVFASVQRAVRSALMGTPVPPFRAVPAPATPFPSTASPTPALALAALKLVPPARQPTFATLPILRVLGQLSNTYIIAEGPDGMYLIDQHTAHERVLFDRLQAQQETKSVELQGLLEPLSLEVTPRQEELLREALVPLSSYGFSLEPFGERAYLLRAVPAVIKGQDPRQVLLETLDSWTQERKAGWAEEIACSLACHGAVRAGQALTHEEMRELVRQLEQTTQPQTCPHGRPIMLHFSAAQLEKGFGRR